MILLGQSALMGLYEACRYDYPHLNTIWIGMTNKWYEVQGWRDMCSASSPEWVASFKVQLSSPPS